jgi:hypothetical protein
MSATHGPGARFAYASVRRHDFRANLSALFCAKKSSEIPANITASMVGDQGNPLRATRGSPYSATCDFSCVCLATPKIARLASDGLDERIDGVYAIDHCLVKANFRKIYAEFFLKEDNYLDSIHGGEPSAEKQRGIVRKGLFVAFLEEQFS